MQFKRGNDIILIAALKIIIMSGNKANFLLALTHLLVFIDYYYVSVKFFLVSSYLKLNYSLFSSYQLSFSFFLQTTIARKN